MKKRLEEKGKMTETPALKTLEVKNLCFYPGKERQVFKDVSMEIKKHEKIAVVGRNGSGKTTLVLNLIGLYERQSGEIFVNGKSAESFTKKAYRGMFTVLFQDYHLFAVKLAENISMDAEWDEKRVRGVLKEEGLEELADCLTEDFSGEFSREGRQFSGG